ncbi:MAG: DEAD/DEAH box helicase family protein [Scytolyngbya sp. HA4215-MV1]|jgi:SNF2 family DNA or RNA helicase|nr:DEAD/DEAH box helicase family protein [Scytolyngbya sp. HA4215-MV1]
MAVAKSQTSPGNRAIQRSGIRDNREPRGSVGDFLKEKIQEGSKLSIVSAYFTIYAFEALKQQLVEIEELKFLFGEPRFVSALDPERTDKKSFKIEDEGLQLQNRLEQKRVARECADWIEAKVQIRSVKQVNLLHGKMYHIDHEGVADAIMGSSNFTVRGLGLGTAGNNIELNLEVDSKRDRQDLKAWFDELWEDEALVEDVKDEVLQYLEQLYQNHCPQFIYYKTLFHIFEKFLADQDASGLLSEKSQLVDTEIWKTLFEFQKDGVKGAINKIRTHNGCIIADSVGLGKTFEALAIIKYFELLNDRVLVLCPKKLRENWTIYQAQNNSELNPFVKDRFSYTVLSHTDLSRDSGFSGDINLETINWGNYDLVVIDESHNFRNNTSSRRDEEGNIIRKSRYERLMEDILKTGIKTKVLLLSATPVNNDLKDLRNQLYFLTEGRDEAFQESFGVTSLKEALATAQRTFTNWSKQTGERKTSDLLEKLSSAFFKLLDELTISRSRKHIQRYYKDTIAALGGFPERLRPIPIYPKIDLRGRFPSYDKINDEISEYQLSLFNPAKYVLPQYQTLYNKGRSVFSQGDREHFLIGMMKVNFLKRLESSVSAFAITMDNTIQKIEALQERIKRFQTLHNQNAEVEAPPMTVAELDDEELRDAMQVGQKLVYQMAHLDVEAWLKDLEGDKDQLVGLYNSAAAISVDRDAKLAELKKLIAQKVQHPTINKQEQPNRKVLVFTAFADTAVYLYEALSSWARSELNIHVALVTGDSSRNKTTCGKSEFNQILTNFSPIAKKRSKMASMPQESEIDLLIATDCISEGQNLQDCDYLVNYDIHWNPVRIIQRFGRIDRIGSLSATVQMVNFWPTEDLNKYINLKNRVEARMALVDIAATQEDNLLANVEDIIHDELKYRDKQLLRLKDEVLDLEDFNETVSLTDFTLDDFRIELSKYIESNRKLLQDAPLGLYAVVPPHPDYDFIAPGVIFCLRQKGTSLGSETVNPLQPHFLVYVRDDRVVRFTFIQPKQILEIYRLLCAEKTTPYEQLCNLFDQQTSHGNDMSVYNELLQAAIASIVSTFRKRTLSNLQSSRSAVLMDARSQIEKTTDFELITWLVIKNWG